MDSDKRKTVKVKLKTIFQDNLNYDPLFKAVTSSNLLITNTYFFMRAYILYILENNSSNASKITEPTINIDFIKLSFNVCSDNSSKKGRPFDEHKKEQLKLLDNFLQIYKEKTSFKQIKVTNISYILGQACIEIYTAIINNIQLHFEKHVKKFIKSLFKNKLILAKESNNKIKLDNLYQSIDTIVKALLSNNNVPDEYKNILKNYDQHIIPSTYTPNKFMTDVEKNTFSYIKCMYVMNKYIQKVDQKSYQFFPTRTSCYSKYVKINTCSLIEIFCDIDKGKYLKQAGNNDIQNELWSKYFKLKLKDKYLYSLNGYSFNYEIVTDGFAASLNFINNNDINNKENIKKYKRDSRIKRFKQKKDCNDKDYQKLLEEEENKKREKKQKQRELAKEIKKKKKDEYNKLSDLEKDEVRAKINEKSEFPYIGQLLTNKNLREQFKKEYDEGKLILCDPGMRSILYMMASNKVEHKPTKNINSANFGISIWKGHKIINYTNKTRIKFTKRKKYGELIENWKDKGEKNNLSYTLIKYLQQIKKDVNDIEYLLKYTKKRVFRKCLTDQLNNRKLMWKKIEKTYNELNIEDHNLKQLEELLSLYNSKSCNINEYYEYIQKKLLYNRIAANKYDTTYLNKLKWFSYINKCKHEDQLLNVIENEFGKDVKIIIGDWSNKGNINYISTPNMGLKRKLSERFKVYLIDEYLTSKIHYKENIKCDNICIAKKGEIKRLHSVLSYKKDNKSGCINRDKNSVLNMERIVLTLIKTGKRLEIFSRKKNNQDYLINESLKENNSDA